MQIIMHKLLCVQISVRLKHNKKSGGHQRGQRRLLFKIERYLFKRLKCNFNLLILFNMQF